MAAGFRRLLLQMQFNYSLLILQLNGTRASIIVALKTVIYKTNKNKLRGP
jgi:hypothetical protein